MAERINWDNINPNDPSFYEADPNNPNTNISASKYDPTDPTSGAGSTGARYNEFLRTANIGDTFDWGNGTQSKFTGFNKAGTPMIQTVESPERQNWRSQINPTASVADNVNALTNAGFNRQEAIFMLAQSGLVDENQVSKYVMGQGATGAVGAASGTKGSGTSGVGGSGSANLVLGANSTNGINNPYEPGTAQSNAWNDRKSAYDLLFSEFNKYGLGSLVEPLKGMITNAQVSPSEFSIALQNTDAYKQRFAANQDRIAKGLKALTPAEYIGLEDQYQNIMRNYGLPSSYYSKDSLGTQAGFNKFIANDVSATELEDRIATAVQRVNNADINVKDALRQFYPSITDGDVLAYTLDPTNALNDIKRKVTAAEIGGAALAQGLSTDVTRAEDLARYGITKTQAQQGYANIGEFLPTATALSDIYNKQGLGPYNQATAEAEVFNTADAAAAARKRKKLSELERATFSGSSGTSNNALSRDRAMTNQMLGVPGAGQF